MQRDGGDEAGGADEVGGGGGVEEQQAAGDGQGALGEKARDFDDIVKSGRTHLMDATPVRLGQEFGGYAAQVAKGMEKVEWAMISAA